jgi:hypothetical protein
MKRLLIAGLLILGSSLSLLANSATTATIWGNGTTIYAKTVKSAEGSMNNHQMRATARLRRDGTSNYIATSQTAWMPGMTASATATMTWTKGAFYNDGIGEVYCPVGRYNEVAFLYPKKTFGASLLCLNKSSTSLSWVGTGTCQTGYWETSTYTPIAGCNAYCAPYVAMTVALCSPTPVQYTIAKDWELDWYSGVRTCYGSFFLVTPASCGAGYCRDVVTE